jgi:DNA-binding CsgD family transcriptional regulator
MLAEVRYFMGWRVYGPDLVRLAMAAGERDDAEAMVAGAALGAERSGGVPTAEAAALRCHARFAADAPAAAKAAELLADSPRRVEAAWAVEDAGTIAASAGERIAAVRFLQDALGRWEAMGGDADATRVETALKSLGARRSGRKPKRRPATGWASLTPTEVAVVELAAEGRTNPQVAEVLFVSRRTVETHLAHVFTKLGLRSRVELAAAWARRREAPAS